MTVKSCEKVEKSQVALTIEVNAAEFEAAVEKAYQKMRRKISVPGFRPGKAPRKMIERMYGAEVFFEEAINIAFPEAYEAAAEQEKLQIVGYPTVEMVGEVTKDGFTFKATTPVYPEVTLGEYKGLKAEKPEVKVLAADVDERLKALADRNTRLVSVEREAKSGDTAVIDFEGFKDGVPFEGGKGENFSLELGSGSFVPGFEEQIVGMNIGDEKDINITFPEDYTAELAGKDVVFKVKLNGLSMTELPELDDDFVQDVSEFNTVEEYRADTRKDMERVMDEQMDAKFRTAIMTKACDNMTVEIPESMMQEKIDELIRSYAANFGLTDPKMSTDDIKKMMGLDEEAIDSTIRPAAEYQVKQELLLNAIVDAENIEVTDEELEDYIKGAAETVGATPEQIRQYFGDEYIRNEFKKEKATKIVIESATEEAPAEESAEKEAE